MLYTKSDIFGRVRIDLFEYRCRMLRIPDLSIKKRPFGFIGRCLGRGKEWRCLPFLHNYQMPIQNSIGRLMLVTITVSWQAIWLFVILFSGTTDQIMLPPDKFIYFIKRGKSLWKYKEIPKNIGSFNAILAAACRHGIYSIYNSSWEILNHAFYETFISSPSLSCYK